MTAGLSKKRRQGQKEIMTGFGWIVEDFRFQIRKVSWFPATNQFSSWIVPD